MGDREGWRRERERCGREGVVKRKGERERESIP